MNHGTNQAMKLPLQHISITNLTKLGNLSNGKKLYRMQGICSPEILDTEVYRILELNAKKFSYYDLLDTIDFVHFQGLRKSEFLNNQDAKRLATEKLEDLSPLFQSLESELKYTNSKMANSLKNWITPYSKLSKNLDAKDLDLELTQFLFERENLSNVAPLAEKSPAQIQADRHEIRPIYETDDNHKELFYQGDAVVHLGLKNTKYGDPNHISVKRWEEWNEALHFICVIGGPILADGGYQWHRRKYLNPRAMGRWQNYF